MFYGMTAQEMQAAIEEYERVNAIVEAAIDWDMVDKVVPAEWMRKYKKGFLSPVDLACKYPECVPDEIHALAETV